MTPHLWHACTPWITRHHRRLSRVAAGLLLLAALIGAAVAFLGLPDRLLLVSFSSIAAAFSLLCLGMIEVWFKARPVKFSEKPAQALLLWYGAIFFSFALLFSLAMVGAGLIGLIWGERP